jgi:uncharacterized protein YegP (UPF0339 family)
MRVRRCVVLAAMIVCLGSLPLAQGGGNRSSAGGGNTPGKFELKKTANGQFFFNLKAANGQTILTSEHYKTKASAENGIASVRKNAANDARYLRKTAKNGKLYFVLTATNGQVIGQSEMYESAAAVEAGIASVKANAPDARVEDLT